METFCTAADGTLTGFVRAPRPRRAGLRARPDGRARRLGPADAARDAGRRGGGLEPGGSSPATSRAPRDDRPAARGVLAAPVPGRGGAWGGFPWDAGQGHELEVFPLADPYTLADVQAGLDAAAAPQARDFWVEGAFAMTPPPVAATLRGLAGLRARLGRLRRAARFGRRGLGRWGALPGMMLVPV